MECNLNFRQQQNSKPDINEIKRRLNLKPEDWDAISFFRHWSSDQYIFDIIKFIPENGVSCEYEINKEGLGNKFLILSVTLDGVIQDEAILGDPLHILLMNYVMGRDQGFIMKKCPEAIVMASKITENAQAAISLFKTFIQGNTATRV